MNGAVFVFLAQLSHRSPVVQIIESFEMPFAFHKGIVDGG